MGSKIIERWTHIHGSTFQLLEYLWLNISGFTELQKDFSRHI